MRDECGDVTTLLRQLDTDESDRAWQCFVDAYGAILLQVVQHFERDPESVRDGFVYVCEQLAADRFRRLRKYRAREQASFTTWLRCVTRNLCIDWRRQSSGRQRSFKAIQELSALEQQVFWCYFVERSSLHETVARSRAAYPEVGEKVVSQIVERISSQLSPRQLWLLSTRSLRTEALDGPGRARFREIAQDGASPEERLLEKERRDRVASSLGQLSRQELHLLRLRFEEDRSLKVCADTLGLGNPQKADRMLHAILARLRSMLPG